MKNTIWVAIILAISFLGCKHKKGSSKQEQPKLAHVRIGSIDKNFDDAEIVIKSDTDNKVVYSKTFSDGSPLLEAIGLAPGSYTIEKYAFRKDGKLLYDTSFCKNPEYKKTHALSNLKAGESYRFKVIICSNPDQSGGGETVETNPGQSGGGETVETDPALVRCYNGVKDEGEEGVDCGGKCSPCKDYKLAPPSFCDNQFYINDPETLKKCGGVPNTANSCSPPEDPTKKGLRMGFICDRFILHSKEMVQAAKDDWNEGSPSFNYAVVGHDPDPDGVDSDIKRFGAEGGSTCCQCYHLVFDKPEPGVGKGELPTPKPLIVQSFNTAASGPKGFDIFMGAGGYGAFNSCYNAPEFNNTSSFGVFQYDGFPSEERLNGSGGVKAISFEKCREDGYMTAKSLSSEACQGEITNYCNKISSPNNSMTENTRRSCLMSNRLNSFYHQNWEVYVKKVQCPENLTRVTGCRIDDSYLPKADPKIQTANQIPTGDATWFREGYHTTTMQDCCKPTCAWKDWVEGRKLTPVGEWRSFYTCDKQGNPLLR